jgi:glycosyltransferase involved in cell wall biosynthesis
LVHTQYVGPVFYNFKYITTIHDILFEKYPEYFSPLFNLRSKIFIRASAKKSAHVFTVSEYSKRELVATYNLDEENVTVINNGVDINRFKPDIFLGNSLEKRGIEPGYVLTVGRLEPRKNHKAIIEAYALAGADLPRLVIVGQRDFKYKEIFELVEKYKLKDKVIFLDDVTDDELPEVYRGAKIFLYPSWAEGFGVPPLEAMASGVPVICSNSTALPEVVGEAGLLCPPQDPPELLRKMKSVLVDPTLQQEMRGRGLRRANMFTWEAAAGKMLEGYEAVLRRRD